MFTCKEKVKLIYPKAHIHVNLIGEVRCHILDGFGNELSDGFLHRQEEAGWFFAWEKIKKCKTKEELAEIENRDLSKKELFQLQRDSPLSRTSSPHQLISDLKKDKI